MAGTIPQNFIDELLSRADLIELLNVRIKLKKQGSNYIALCPFHQEKTPSFSVNPNKQFYYCFGCGASGNAIHFLMHYERMTFPEAVEYLAHQHGMSLPERAPAQQDEQSGKLYELLAYASKLYQKQLRRFTEAQTYLKSRGLSGTTAKHYALGYAPEQWQFICQHLGRSREEQDLLLKSGLISAKNNRYYDRFRGRIIFPIRNHRGKTLGFGGRSMDGSEPKYLNSPETHIFHKKYELYGLYEALNHNQSLSQLIIVEGYMDVLALAEQGISNAVATLGTSITGHHVQKLFRYCQDIVFCFDSDDAGLRAAWRALQITLPHMREDVNARFLILPQGQDPDDFVKQNGPEAFQRLVAQAVPLADYLFNQLRQQSDLNRLEGRAYFARQILSYINTMPQGVYQHLLYEKLSEMVNVSIDQLQQFSQQNNQNHKTAKQPSRKRLKGPTAYERLLALMLQYPDKAATFSHELQSVKPFNTTIQYIQKLLEILRHNPQINISQLLNYSDDENERRYLARLAQEEITTPQSGVAAELKARLKTIRSEAIDYENQQLTNQLRHEGTDENRRRLMEMLKRTKGEERFEDD